MDELPERDLAKPERSAFKGTAGFARLYHALLHSRDGLSATFTHESAFRQALLLAAVLIPTSFAVSVVPVERALLIGSTLLVPVVELINSGIEAAIDRVSLERHPLSKRAKDAGSAAVLMSLVLLASVWAVILLPKLA